MAARRAELTWKCLVEGLLCEVARGEWCRCILPVRSRDRSGSNRKLRFIIGCVLLVEGHVEVFVDVVDSLQPGGKIFGDCAGGLLPLAAKHATTSTAWPNSLPSMPVPSMGSIGSPI
jgi:hypothetical protein